MSQQSPNSLNDSLRMKEWREVENLIANYQLQFIDSKYEKISKVAANELLERFSPLFKKYIQLLKTGQINFMDTEMKLFVLSFIEDLDLQKALRRNKQRAVFRTQIYQRFNFVKETYGTLTPEEILIDLQTIFLLIAKRYKQIGRSFCGYLYNVYRHEVSRHIKKFINNPLNITYKNMEYEDCINPEYRRVSKIDSLEKSYEDNYYEDATGLPDSTWISGMNCSDIFLDLSPLERKILIKYYLEYWNDRQISNEFGIHINTVNQKRRNAVNKIALELNINIKLIKRNRRSGKLAVLPNNNL